MRLPLHSAPSRAFALFLLATLPLSCGPRTPLAPRPEAHAEPRWLVIAPHPDDEALIAAGVIGRQAARGAPIAVAIMTNGDFECIHDGLVRERESVAALTLLGVPKERIYFLGYPDGGLPSLGRAPLPQKRRERDGACREGTTTYGAHGFGGTDYHHARTGAPATYTRDNAVGDLVALLEEVQPTDVAITHPADTHPDHETTYTLFRDALRHTSFLPRHVHRALVHNGDCWPTGPEPHEPCAPPTIAPDRSPPPLTGRLDGYTPRELLPVPERWTGLSPMENPKVRAIAAYPSQTRATFASYLFGFAWRVEPFFTEEFEPTLSGPRRVGTVQRGAMTRTMVHLEPGTTSQQPATIPLSLAFEMPPGRLEIGFLEDETGGYTLAIDSAQRLALLSRRSKGGAPATVKTWTLPHDLWEASPAPRFTLHVDPRPEDGAVAEFSLESDTSLLGVATEMKPRTAGSWMSGSFYGAARTGLDVRVSAFPSAPHAP